MSCLGSDDDNFPFCCDGGDSLNDVKENGSYATDTSSDNTNNDAPQTTDRRRR